MKQCKPPASERTNTAYGGTQSKLRLLSHVAHESAPMWCVPALVPSVFFNSQTLLGSQHDRCGHQQACVVNDERSIHRLTHKFFPRGLAQLPIGMLTGVQLSDLI